MASNKKTTVGGVSVLDGAVSAASLALTTDLPVSEGGTGASTAAAARTNLLPSKTSNALKVLRVNAGETDYELAAAGGGDLLAANNLSDLADLLTALTNLLNGNQAVGLIIENRTSDPGSPVAGQIWLRTDL